MGYHLLYTKGTELCVDIEADTTQALQAHERAEGRVYVRMVIPIAESAAKAM